MLKLSRFVLYVCVSCVCLCVFVCIVCELMLVVCILCVCVYMCVCVCICVYVCVRNVCVVMSVCMCVCACMCMCVCVLCVYTYSACLSVNYGRQHMLKECMHAIICILYVFLSLYPLSSLLYILNLGKRSSLQSVCMSSPLKVVSQLKLKGLASLNIGDYERELMMIFIGRQIYRIGKKQSCLAPHGI
jgi:hypothetical protein